MRVLAALHNQFDDEILELKLLDESSVWGNNNWQKGINF
jgi:hypothetical protein